MSLVCFFKRSILFESNFARSVFAAISLESLDTISSSKACCFSRSFSRSSLTRSISRDTSEARKRSVAAVATNPSVSFLSSSVSFACCSEVMLQAEIKSSFFLISNKSFSFSLSNALTSFFANAISLNSAPISNLTFASSRLTADVSSNNRLASSSVFSHVFTVSAHLSRNFAFSFLCFSISIARTSFSSFISSVSFLACAVLFSSVSVFSLNFLSVSIMFSTRSSLSKMTLSFIDTTLSPCAVSLIVRSYLASSFTTSASRSRLALAVSSNSRCNLSLFPISSRSIARTFSNRSVSFSIVSSSFSLFSVSKVTSRSIATARSFARLIFFWSSCKITATCSLAFRCFSALLCAFCNLALNRFKRSRCCCSIVFCAEESIKDDDSDEKSSTS